MTDIPLLNCFNPPPWNLRENPDITIKYFEVLEELRKYGYEIALVKDEGYCKKCYLEYSLIDEETKFCDECIHMKRTN